MTNFPFLCYRLVRWGDRAPHPGLRILHFAGLHGGIHPGRVPHPSVHAVELPLPPDSRPQPAWTRSAIITAIVKWTTVNVNHCLTVRLIYTMCSTSGAWTWKKKSAAFPSRVFVQSSVEPAQILQSVLRRHSHQNLSTQTAHREGAQGNYIFFLTHSGLETKFCSSSLDAFKCALNIDDAVMWTVFLRTLWRSPNGTMSASGPSNSQWRKLTGETQVFFQHWNLSKKRFSVFQIYTIKLFF